MDTLRNVAVVASLTLSALTAFAMPATGQSLPSSAHKLNAQSVLPASDPFSHGYVVNAASRPYFFPPDTTITTANGLVMVRAYGNLFVFRASKVTVRQLSSTAVTSRLSAESNEAMVGGILAAIPHRTLLPNDACRDCVVPVARGFLSDTTYGAQPIPTPYQPSFGTGFSLSPGTGTIRRSKIASMPSSSTSHIEPTLPSAACFPSNYVVAIRFGACEARSRSFNQQSLYQTIRPMSVSGYGYAYEWFEQYGETELVAYDPPSPPKGVYFIWDGEYFDADGDQAYGGGKDVNNPKTLTGYYAFPSTTWDSEMIIQYATTSYLPLGGATGVYATIIP